MTGAAEAIAKDAAARGRAPAIALDDVTISFRMAGEHVYTAVERASLSVADGEFVSIVGPTGCGKSTLLNVAAGLLAPSSGNASIFGRPLSGLTASGGVGGCAIMVGPRNDAAPPSGGTLPPSQGGASVDQRWHGLAALS